MLTAVIAMLTTGPLAHAAAPVVADVHLAVDGSHTFWSADTADGAASLSSSGLGMQGGLSLAVPVVPRVALGLAAHARHRRLPLQQDGEPVADVRLQTQTVDLMGVFIAAQPETHHVVHHQLGAGYTLGRGALLPDGEASDSTGLRGFCLDYATHLNVVDMLGEGAWSRRHSWSLGLQAGLSFHMLTPQDLSAYTPDNSWGAVPDLSARLGLSAHVGGPPSKAEARRKQKARKKKRKQRRPPRDTRNTGPGRR